MVLLTSLLAVVALGGRQDNGTLLSKLFPVPSGKNGYEEYVMAADMADRDLWGIYQDWLQFLFMKKPGMDVQPGVNAPELPPLVNVDMTDLEVRKVMDRRFSSAIHFVEEGNRKSVVNPHQVLNLSSTFPELANFKVLSKVDVNKAHVEFSDGNTSAAVKDLVEGLKFSHNIFGTTRISSLVSVAAQTMVLAEFEGHLGQLSFFDAQDLDKETKTLLESRLPWEDLLRIDYNAAAADLDAILDKPEILFSDPKERAYAQMFSGISPSDRQQLKGLVIGSLETRMNDELQRLTGPESGWIIKDQSTDQNGPLSDHSVSNLALILVNSLSGKDLKSNYVRGIAKGRIQLRLLRLHAQVIEYKWMHNKLPDKLEDFAMDGAGFDAIANEPFHYELKNGSYRIYSLGIPGMGRIELRYRNVSPAPSTDAPPTQFLAIFSVLR